MTGRVRVITVHTGWRRIVRQTKRVVVYLIHDLPFYLEILALLPSSVYPCIPYRCSQHLCGWLCTMLVFGKLKYQKIFSFDLAFRFGIFYLCYIHTCIQSVELPNIHFPKSQSSWVFICYFFHQIFFSSLPSLWVCWFIANNVASMMWGHKQDFFNQHC